MKSQVSSQAGSLKLVVEDLSNVICYLIKLIQYQLVMEIIKSHQYKISKLIIFLDSS